LTQFNDWHILIWRKRDHDSLMDRCMTGLSALIDAILKLFFVNFLLWFSVKLSPFSVWFYVMHSLL